MRRALLGLMVAGLLVHVGVHAAHALHVTPSFAFIPLTLALAAFTAANAAALMGWRAAVALFAVGVPLGWIAEQVGVATGFPFGPYYYTEVFGPRLGHVPLIIPPAWAVIVWLGTVVGDLALEGRVRTQGTIGRLAFASLVGAFVVTAFDLAADPFFVFEVKAWHMEREGNYFGEQARGFAGWVLTSFVIGITFRLVARRVGREPTPADHRVATLLPLVAYAAWAVFFAFFGFPPGTRAVAVFAMGLPVLIAGWRWWSQVREAA